MTQKIFVGLIFAVFVLTNPSNVFADVHCSDPANKQNTECVFGKIQAPSPIAGFLDKNPTGSGAISQFLSNFISLIYVAAAIVLIFMILWGAFDWMTSGGDKEKVAAAQRKIINAVIGILLFAIAFAIIRVLGTFTGFTFFKG